MYEGGWPSRTIKFGGGLTSLGLAIIATMAPGPAAGE